MVRWTGDDADDYDDEGAITINGKTITITETYVDGEGFTVTMTRVNDKDNTSYDFWNDDED